MAKLNGGCSERLVSQETPRGSKLARTRAGCGLRQAHTLAANACRESGSPMTATASWGLHDSVQPTQFLTLKTHTNLLSPLHGCHLGAKSRRKGWPSARLNIFIPKRLSTSYRNYLKYCIRLSLPEKGI